jgi:hypothetical protein
MSQGIVMISHPGMSWFMGQSWRDVGRGGRSARAAATIASMSAVQDCVGCTRLDACRVTPKNFLSIPRPHPKLKTYHRKAKGQGR